MHPVKFDEANRNLFANPAQPDIDGLPVESLPIYTDELQCVSKWKLGWKERLQVLVFGHVWLGIHSGGTQPPVWISAECPFQATENIPAESLT